jgi:hypothetical protein
MYFLLMVRDQNVLNYRILSTELRSIIKYDSACLIKDESSVCFLVYLITFPKPRLHSVEWNMP